MKNKCLLLSVVALFTATMTADASAQSRHGAHTHGEGTLNAIRDRGTMSITINLPGADVVGFEHEAESETDIRTVRDALAILGDVSRVLAVPGAADCTVQSAGATTNLLHNEGNHGHERADKHAHEHEKEDRGGHGGFEAHYELNCGSPDALENIVIKLFSIFPSLHKIEAVMVSGTEQRAKKLTVDDNTISLAK